MTDGRPVTSAGVAARHRRGYDAVRWQSLAVGFVLVCGLIPAAPAVAASAPVGRCHTTAPGGTAMSTPFGNVYLGTQSGYSGGLGDTNVDTSQPAVQANIDAGWTQVYVAPGDPSTACVRVAGNIEVGDAWTYPATPPPTTVAMPWLSRTGSLWKTPDGQTTILHGIDYAFDHEFLSGTNFLLTDADLDRIHHDWGMNLLRVRFEGVRAGMYPNHPIEVGYLDALDQLIARANTHGLYVLLSNGGADLWAWQRPEDETYDQQKFIAGTPAQLYWLQYQEAIFARYRTWPGIVGFDPINEDYSYPPMIHDQVFMGPGHAAVLSRLRHVDPRHTYFQQSSGWGYWSLPITGTDLGDTNRSYCMKWAVQPSSPQVSSRMATMQAAAQQANVPLTICEWYVAQAQGSDQSSAVAAQRQVLTAMDSHLVGGARFSYQPQSTGAYPTLINADRSETFWTADLVRPYPEWAGGAISSITWDFVAHRLALGLDLNGAGPSSVFVPQTRMYPSGFNVTTTAGGHLVYDGQQVVTASGLTWDPSTEQVIVPAGQGHVDITVASGTGP